LVANVLPKKSSKTIEQMRERTEIWNACSYKIKCHRTNKSGPLDQYPGLSSFLRNDHLVHESYPQCGSQFLVYQCDVLQYNSTEIVPQYHEKTYSHPDIGKAHHDHRERHFFELHRSVPSEVTGLSSLHRSENWAEHKSHWVVVDDDFVVLVVVTAAVEHVSKSEVGGDDTHGHSQSNATLEYMDQSKVRFGHNERPHRWGDDTHFGWFCTPPMVLEEALEGVEAKEIDTKGAYRLLIGGI
jgi:hypothetical protein